MKTLALAFLLVFALGTNPVNAAENSIDIQLEIDMHNAKTNSDMIRAHLKALKKWDADMNRTYKELKRLMTPNAWKDLVKAQKPGLPIETPKSDHWTASTPPGVAPCGFQSRPPTPWKSPKPGLCIWASF